MSKRWLVILLLISAAFNLAVMGSFIYLRSTRPPFPPGHHGGWERRGPGRGPGGGHRGPGPMFDFGDSTQILFERFDKIKLEMMRELAKDPLDMATIDTIVNRSLGAQADLERDLVNRLIRFRKSLTPEEAKEHFTRRAQEMERHRQERPYQRHKRRNH